MDLDRLGRVDWDFPGAGNVPGTVHSLYSFPGNFIPQLPSAFVQLLSSPGDVVLDPFCGTGTTAIAALALDRNAIVSDQMKSSLLVSNAKVALSTTGLDRETYDQLLSSLVFDHECRSEEVGKKGEGTDPELERWYSPDTMAQLRYLWRLTERYEGDTSAILIAAFSEVLFQCASTRGALTRTGKKRRHHWGWIADNVRPAVPLENNAVALFREAIADAAKIIPLPTKRWARVSRQDARQMQLPSETVDLVVTSPPYVGMIDYTHASRMTHLWMGWSIREERHDEIGARYRRNRANLRVQYIDDMTRCASEIHRVLRPKGHCAIVVGESRVFNGAALQVIAAFERYMTLAWGPHERRATRRRVSDRQASDAVEHLAVFQKS